jgi:hypothetical protein
MVHLSGFIGWSTEKRDREKGINKGKGRDARLD